ncbi:MAG: tetratricopeptide repeat protein [bacterium]
MRIAVVLFGVLGCLTIAPVAPAVDKQQKGVSVSDSDHNVQDLLDQADQFFAEHDYQTALAKYEELVGYARQEFNRSVEVEALAQVARVNLILENRDEGRTWLEQAASRADETDPMGWSRYLGVKGRYEWKDDDLVAARKTFDQMYTFCNTNGLWGRAVDAAHMIAIVAETPEEQIEWNRLGIEAAEAGDQENWLGPLWNNMAITHFDMKQYDSALTCFVKAREYHWRFSGEIAKLFADYHVGMTCRYLGRYDEAGKWLRPVLAWAERLENHGAIGQTCEDLGEIALAQKRDDEGIKLLKRARAEYQLEGYDKSWPDVWDHINKRLGELGQ